MKRTFGPICVLMAFGFGALAGPSRGAENTDEMLRWVPRMSNALAIIDVASLRKSTLGQQGSLGEGVDGTGLIGPNYPRSVDTLVVGSIMDLGNLDRSFTTGIIRFDQEITPAEVARAEGGVVEPLGEGKEVVWSPRKMYFAPLGPKLVGAMASTNRQMLSRWIEDGPSKAVIRLAPYLTSAARAPSAQIVMAVDLSGYLPEHLVRKALTGSSALAGKKADVGVISRLISEMRGLTLAIEVRRTILGRLQLDFNETVGTALNEETAKVLVIEALGNWGAMVDDIENWSCRVSGRSVVLEGALSVDGARRLASLVELPAPTIEVGKSPGQADPTSPSKPGLEASRTYYGSVTTLLKDLRSQKAESAGSAALWYERYAAKIDQLPILGVDPELLAYGADVAKQLRDMSNAIRGVGLGTNYRMSFAYGYENTQYNQTKVKRQEAVQADVYLRQAWKAIDDRTAELRRIMTQRYQVEF